MKLEALLIEIQPYKVINQCENVKHRIINHHKKAVNIDESSVL